MSGEQTSVWDHTEWTYGSERHKRTNTKENVCIWKELPPPDDQGHWCLQFCSLSDKESELKQMKAWCTLQLRRRCHAWSCPSDTQKRPRWAVLQTGPLRIPACCCCWPTHSQGPLEIKVQPTTRRESREKGKEGCLTGTDVATQRWPS